MMFHDRADAGKKLAEKLEKYKGQNVLVLGLPRGGVIVAREVAKTLGSQLDVIITKKIGAAENPEYAVGAVSEAGEIVKSWYEPEEEQKYLEKEAAGLKKIIQKRIELYRQGRELPKMEDKIVILVDDGIATGLTVMAAIHDLKKRNPKKLILAVPVAPPDTVEWFKNEVDEVVVLETPTPFIAVGNFYENFEQTSDEEVIEALTNHSASSTHL